MMKKIRFTKMQGVGNDFVVLDAINQSIQLNEEQIRHLSDRHFGIGCDQVLLVEKPTLRDADFTYRIFNRDGTEAEQCGNGARCFVRFVHENKLTNKKQLTLQTKNGLIHPLLEDDGQITVNMGKPIFTPHAIPFLVDKIAPTYTLVSDGQHITINALSMGNPHAVLFVDSVKNAPVHTIGPNLQHHPNFPEKVNVGFVEVLTSHHIKLRVFERGAGETLACGTGACAAVVAGIQRGLLDKTALVDTLGGQLTITWSAQESPVFMTGPAEIVFHGEILL